MSFINTAHAAGAAGQAGDSGFGILLVIAFTVMFYLLIWRPQSKRSQELRELIDNIKVGDEVVTNGGILGKISKMDETFLEMVIADGISIFVQKQAVAACVPKGTFKPKTKEQ